MSCNVHCVIMGGGRGDRLFPLTMHRCKPAMPLAGRYRLIDIPISNCLNSGFKKIYILTQFNTRSLHRHIEETYKFDIFGRSKIEILQAEQDLANDCQWYSGTADAVRKNLKHIRPQRGDIILILSGDQLYRMDLQNFVNAHKESGADVTVAAKAIPESKVSSFGIMSVDDQLKIKEFVEKPKKAESIQSCAVPSSIRSTLSDKNDGAYYLASMGIYAFSAGALCEILNEGVKDINDFGKDVLPDMLKQNYHMRGYVFDDFWEDVGTVRSFFDTNLMLTDSVPKFKFFDAENPIYTRARCLPACKIDNCKIESTLLSDGCIISGATLNRCVIGHRSVINHGSFLENVIMFGAGYFDRGNAEVASRGDIQLGIGRDCVIKNAIIDKNVRIGDGVQIDPSGKPDGYEDYGIYVRDGIACVTRDAKIENGTIF